MRGDSLRVFLALAPVTCIQARFYAYLCCGLMIGVKLKRALARLGGIPIALLGQQEPGAHRPAIGDMRVELRFVIAFGAVSAVRGDDAAAFFPGGIVVRN